MNCSIFACCFIFLVLTVNGQILDEHAGVRDRCLKELRLEKVELSGGSTSFLQHPKAKCYLKCFIEGLNLFNEDNSIDIARSLELINEEIREEARPFITNCVNDNKDFEDRCEKSFAVINCLCGASPQIFLQLGIIEPPKTE